jgi:hypothetical protein
VSRTVIGRIAFDSEEYMRDTSSVFCLLCIVRKKNDLQQNCLALIPTGREADEYRRMGLVSVCDQMWFGMDVPQK